MARQSSLLLLVVGIVAAVYGCKQNNTTSQAISSSLPDVVFATRVTLEENGGEGINVFMPYRKRMLRGIAYGEIFASAGDHSVFI